MVIGNESERWKRKGEGKKRIIKEEREERRADVGKERSEENEDKWLLTSYFFTVQKFN